MTKREVAEIIDSIRAELQGHCPAELYEDGVMDALAAVDRAVLNFVVANPSKDC